MIKGAIFDMDGLMFDTEVLSTKGWLQAGKELDFPITEEFISKFRGTNIAYSRKLFLDTYGKKVDYDKAREVRTLWMDAEIEKNGVPIKKGLIELLCYLQEHHFLSAVATSTHKELADKYLNMADVSKYFNYFIYGNMVEHSKPNPEIFLRVAGGLNLLPEECVVLEDSPHGISAGYSAGCKVIGIPDTIPFTDEVYSLCTTRCTDLSEAINYFEKWSM